MKSPRPTIAISRCLTGERVRYDGASKPASGLVAWLHTHFNLLPICPEVEIGMGVPRPPIQLMVIDGLLRAQAVHPPHTEVTLPLQQFGQRIAQLPIAALVLKSRSPSCGVGTTPHYSAATEWVLGHGVVTATLIEQAPQIPIIDELGLCNASQQQLFARRVWAHHRRSAHRDHKALT